ncbi:MAG: hypothetical protein ACE5I7_13220 [Candidatus Binatia bacterium]
MTRRLQLLLLLLALGTFGVLAAVVHSQTKEASQEEPPPVSESDLQLYIKVYAAMQEDHDLTIDNAVKPSQMSLEDFRRLERRIQGKPRLVDRVRQALLNHAREHSVFAHSVVSPGRAATAGPGHDRSAEGK